MSRQPSNYQQPSLNDKFKKEFQALSSLSIPNIQIYSPESFEINTLHELYHTLSESERTKLQGVGSKLFGAFKGTIKGQNLYKDRYNFTLYLQESLNLPPIIIMENKNLMHMLVTLGRGRFYFYSNNIKYREQTSHDGIEKSLRDFSKWFDTLPPRDYVDAKNLGYYPVNLSLWSIYSTEGASQRFIKERDSENQKQ